MTPSPDLDLAARIDRSLGSGPAPPWDAESLLARGRQRRRRRRGALVVAASALVVAGVVVGMPAWSGRPGHADVAGTPVEPSARPGADPTVRVSATPAPPTAAQRERLKRLAERAATFEGDGRVELARGAVVVRSLDDPFEIPPPGWSRGLAVRFGGHEFWYAMSGPGDGSVSGSTQYLVLPGEGRGAFEAFVAAQRPGAATTTVVGPDVWPDVAEVDLVRLQAGGVLEARPGNQVLEQRAGVDVGRAWAGPGDETAAALVRAADGSAYFVLARRFAGKPAQYVAVPRSGNGADLAAFLQRASERYAASVTGR